MLRVNAGLSAILEEGVLPGARDSSPCQGEGEGEGRFPSAFNWPDPSPSSSPLIARGEATMFMRYLKLIIGKR
jgi:hypothetical protein